MRLDKNIFFSLILILLLFSCNNHKLEPRNQTLISKADSINDTAKLFTIKDVFPNILNPEKYLLSNVHEYIENDSIYFTYEINKSVHFSLVIPKTNNPIEPLSMALINNKKYDLFCDLNQENCYPLDLGLQKLYKLIFNNKIYLVLINGINRCNDLNCRIRCFNIFELNHDKIIHYSFRSVYGDINYIGDFNNDGTLDYVSVQIDYTREPKSENTEDYYNYHVLGLCSMKSGEISCSSNKTLIKYVKEKSIKDFTFQIIGKF